MTPERMDFREAWSVAREGHPQSWAVPPDKDKWGIARERYYRACAIVDAAVEAHETAGASREAFLKLRRMERGCE